MAGGLDGLVTELMRMHEQSLSFAFRLSTRKNKYDQVYSVFFIQKLKQFEENHLKKNEDKK